MLSKLMNKPPISHLPPWPPAYWALYAHRDSLCYCFTPAGPLRASSMGHDPGVTPLCICGAGGVGRRHTWSVLVEELKQFLGRTETCSLAMCDTLPYCDLGKVARGVVSNGYGFGMVKIDLRTKSYI